MTEGIQRGVGEGTGDEIKGQVEVCLVELARAAASQAERGTREKYVKSKLTN